MCNHRELQSSPYHSWWFHINELLFKSFKRLERDIQFSSNCEKQNFSTLVGWFPPIFEHIWVNSWKETNNGCNSVSYKCDGLGFISCFQIKWPVFPLGVYSWKHLYFQFELQKRNCIWPSAIISFQPPSQFELNEEDHHCIFGLAIQW